VTIRVSFNGKAVGQLWSAQTKRYSEKMVKATQASARRAAAAIETRGRENIKAGGNFGSARWQAGFRAYLSFRSRVRLSIRVTHSVFYWRVFEFGAKIFGRPLLWIPLPWAREAQGIRARDYPGNLFRVERLGRSPLLMARTGAGTVEAKYVGKEFVVIPRKWRLRDIVRQEQKRLGRYYREALRTNG